MVARSHRLFQLASAAVTLAGLIAAGSLCISLLGRERAELQRTSQAEATQIASRLHAGMTAAMEPIQGLGLWWLSQGEPEDREDWRTDAQLFLTRATGLRQAFWVDPDGYQRWMAVPDGDPAVQRVRPPDPIGDLVAAAADRRSMTVSEVWNQPGVPNALYVCFPLYRNPPLLQGYVVGLYDARALIASLARSGVRSDHRIAVSFAGRRVYSTLTAASAAPRSAVASFDLAQAVWSVDLSVPLNYFREFRGLIFTVAGVVGALIYSFCTLLYFSQRQSLALYRANEKIGNLNRELRRKVEDFQTLLDVNPVGIAVAEDARCRSVRVNPALARMLGVPPGVPVFQDGPAAQRSWRITRNGRELRPEELPMQVAAVTGKGVLGEEDRIVRADATEVDILSFAVPLFDEHGGVRGVLNASVDISERKAQERVRRELEQNLQRAQRMKSLGVMAAGMAHDFNNLLTGIIGRASLAADILSPGSDAHEHISACLQSAEEAARLIGKVLAYTGRAYRKPSCLDIGQLFAELYPQLAELAAGKARIRLAIAPQLPPVVAARDEVRQIIRNLIMNSVETAETDTIEIRADVYQATGAERNLAPVGERLPAGAYLRIRVTDNGSGMTADIAERAFEPFFSTKFLGRGLGLAEVLGIMRAHKGGVYLETVPNEGTSVTLYFPAGQTSSTRAA